LGGIDRRPSVTVRADLVRARLRRENLDGDQAKVARRLVGMLARAWLRPEHAFDVVSTEMGLELERRAI